ncbi:MAG: prolyl oligopeptidase family serine peptidase [Myxococcota bacterium]
MFAHRSLTVFALAFILSLTACGEDTGEDTPDTGVQDVGADADISEDTRDAGDAGDAEQPRTCVESTPVAVSEPDEIEIIRWYVGQPTGGDASQMISDIESGDFVLPPNNSEAYGDTWQTAYEQDDGSIDGRGRSGSYFAATRIEVEQPQTYFIKPDSIFRVWANGNLQPGDPYGHGDKRVPLKLEAGENLVVVQGSGRKTPKVEIWTTPDAVFFNTGDMTAPHLRHGDDTDLPLGMMVVNGTDRTLYDVRARVVENEYVEATTVEIPAIGPSSTTQVPFELEPKGPWTVDEEAIPVTLRLESCELEAAYDKTIEMTKIDAEETYRRTFRSPIDGSVQYYGVVEPTNVDPQEDYGLALALHGASVEALGHARAYSKKDGAYIIAPTNRRRFGFDWEEWGRLNGIAALDDAMASFNIDPTQLHVTGHSMGGHGTWHLGVMHSNRFASIGPSAGWASFYSYGGATRPSGAIGRARAHSDTKAYMSNLADRGGYIIHGSADTNVPVSEGRDLRDALLEHTDDVEYHEEEGAGHWWNGDVAEGTDCVDWPALFEFLGMHTVDPVALDFNYRGPGPWVNPEYSYVTVRSTDTPMEDFELTSQATSDTAVALTTSNVRSMELDTAALDQKGITTLDVDGQTVDVTGDIVEIGPQDGKNEEVSGPLNQAFQRPFCVVYPDSTDDRSREYVSYLISTWALNGNGHACGMPVSELTDEIRAERNIIYVGVPFSAIPDGESRPFSWTEDAIEIGPNSYGDSAATIVFPEGDRLSAAFVTTAGSEDLQFNFQPFSSRAGMPDYLVYGEEGANAVGFFDANWEFDASLGQLR